VWKQLAADDEMLALVITGAGRAFSGGGDLNLLDRMVHDTDLRAAIMEEGASSCAHGEHRMPIIAAVNGPAVGLGCSLAGLSDIVLVEEQAYFADPHVALGLVAGDGGAMTWPLPPASCAQGVHPPRRPCVGGGTPCALAWPTRRPHGTAVEEALALRPTRRQAAAAVGCARPSGSSTPHAQRDREPARLRIATRDAFVRRARVPRNLARMLDKNA